MYQKTLFENLIEINFEKKVSIEDLRPWSFSKYDSYLSCPIKFFFRYIYKIDVEKNKFLAFGNGVHLVIEKLLTKPITLNEQVILNLAKGIKYKMEPLFDIDIFKKYTSYVLEFVEKIKKNYSNFEVEASYACDENFSYVTYESKNSFLRGKVDLILEQPFEIQIIDHKTTGILNNRPLENILETLKDKSYKQLLWYAVLVSLKKQRKTFTLSFFVIKNGKIFFRKIKKLDTKHTFLKIKNRLLNIEKKLINKSILEVINKKNFEILKVKNKKLCFYCDYIRYCKKLEKFISEKKYW